MSNEYQIATIKDFLAVPPESIDACLADFKQWIELARNGSEFAKDFNEFIGMPGATSMVQDSFTWIDDGIAGIARIDLTDPQSGERFARISFEDESA